MDLTVFINGETADQRHLRYMMVKAYFEYVRHLRRLPVFNEFADDFLYYYGAHYSYELNLMGNSELLYQYLEHSIVTERCSCDLVFPQKEVW